MNAIQKIFEHIMAVLPEGGGKITLEPQPKENVSRYAVIFNGTAYMKDKVAARNLGMTKELVNKWLTKGYDKIFLLMDAKNLWEGDSRVVMLPPTAEDLKMVTSAMQAAGLDSNDNVEIMVHGHGGGEGKEHYIGLVSAAEFIGAINLIPKEAQRIIRLSECHAASFLDHGQVRDANDLMNSYSGAMDAPTEGGGKKSELNWTDGREMGILDAKDTDGDGELANWEMFWKGIEFSFMRELPFTRGFIFDPGPDYVDYGFGQKPLAKPFPAHAVEVKNLKDFIELTGRGYEKGITVVCWNFGLPEYEKTIEDFKAEAVRQNGWVQFLLIDAEVSNMVYNPAGSYKMRDVEPLFEIHFRGEDFIDYNWYRGDFPYIKALVDAILHGRSLKLE